MKEVEKYLNNLGSKQRLAIESVIKTIKSTVSNTDEMISYGMPVYKYKGKYLIGVAAFKDHMSIFPGSGAVKEFSGKLKTHKLSKGTIQFEIQNPIDEKTLVEIIKYCKSQIDSK